MAADEWYYKHNSQEYGPVEFEELWNLAHSERLQPGDQIRQGTAGDWVPAQSMDGLFPDAEELTNLDELNIEFVNSGTPAAPDEPEEPTELDNLDDLNFEFVDSSDPTTPPQKLEPAAPPTPEPMPTEPAPIPTSAGPKEWYFKSLGQEFGPLTKDEILQSARDGALSLDDMVKQGENSGFRPAEQFPEIYNAIPAEEMTGEVIAPEPEGVDFSQASQQKNEKTHAETTPPAESDPPAETVPPQEQKPAAHTSQDKLKAWLDAEVPDPADPAPSTTTEPQPVAASSTPASTAGADTTAAPAPIPAPAATSTAPPSFTPQKKKKQKAAARFSFDMSGFAAALGEQKKMIMVLAGLLLLLVGWKLLPLISFGREAEYHTQLSQLHAELISLRENKAADSDWEAFSTKARTALKPMLADLKKTASAKNRKAQELQWAARDYFPKMLTDSRKEPSRNETFFTKHLANAKQLIDGADPAAINAPGSNDEAPPEPTM